MTQASGTAEVNLAGVEVSLDVKVTASQVQCTLVFEDNQVVLTFGRDGTVSGIAVPGLSGAETRELITGG